MTFGNTAKFFFVITVIFFIHTHYSYILGQPNIIAEPYDIVISEIMADPTPVQKLPECEYLELFNRSSQEFNLSGWTITAGKNLIILPDSVIGPAEYVLVTDTSFDCYGDFEFKSLKIKMPHITNTGQAITLRSPSGYVIHSVNFTDDWYNNEEKDDGGWSFEMIDADNPCGGRKNWQASDDISGGSPGRKNQVSRLNPDKAAPFIMHATLCADTAVNLHFNEPIYYPDAFETRLFTVDQGLYHPESAYPVEPGYTDVILKYKETFQSDNTYHVTILNELRDCAGNHPSDGLNARFACTKSAGISDIIINEILFEAGKGIEFVEIFNRSNKVIDLSSLNLALAGESNVIEKSIRLSDVPSSIFPGEYRVICKNGDKLADCFPHFDPVTLSELYNLFTLPDEGGLLVIEDTSGLLIDECVFSKDLHYSLLSSTAGVSLERINIEMPSGDRSNWHSASYSSGFGSPGKKNSQQPVGEDEFFSLSSEIVSPDGDGLDDEVILYFNLTEPGWTGDVIIFTLNGQKIKTILSNKLLGTAEMFTWDGCADDGNKASPGTYLVFAELFSSKGEIKKFKKVVSVVKK